MQHPLHLILKRWLESEQSAFDANTRKLWQSVAWLSNESETSDRSSRAPRSNDGGAYRESEVPS